MSTITSSRTKTPVISELVLSCHKVTRQSLRWQKYMLLVGPVDKYSHISTLTVDTDPGVDDTIAMYVIVTHLIFTMPF